MGVEYRSSENTRGVQERDGNNEEQDDDQDDGNAAPLPSATLVVLRDLQLLGAAVDEGARLAHLLLDVVQLIALRVHQRRHVVMRGIIPGLLHWWWEHQPVTV
jgi:hypothetical protein